MICVFDIGNNYFEGNGNAVLTPTDAKVKMVAGGNYDLTMNHPMDPDGKWRHLVPGAVVRVPIPEEEIENAFAGYAADVYKTTEEAALREGPNEPTTITYPTWAVGNSYAVGTKVSFLNKNYTCTYWDSGSGFIYLDPAHSDWWKEIARTTSGAAVMVTLPAGTELYFVEDVDATWYKMSTYYGIEGYIKKSQVEFWKHLTPEETKPRIIREQLFRIVNATADTKARTVSVTAQHVSYDLNGIIVKDVVIRQASPAMAIGRMVEGFMIPYAGTIATNLTSEDNGTYTDEIKGKTGMYCFLDPDKGIVGKFGAALKRDNWDLFILQKTETDRGFRIAYRKNQLGVNWARKSDGLVTRVVPVAKDEKGEPLYLPEMWIDSEHIDEYPVIRMERLSMKEQVGKDKGLGDDSVWELSDLLDEMREKAAERFTVDQADRIVDEVTVDFEMLGDTAEYKWLRGLEKVLLYDTVTAVNEEIGLEMPLTVNELEWDAIRQKVVSVKVSNVANRAGRSVTGYNVQNKSIGWQKLTDDVSDDILSQVRDIIPEYADPEAPRPAIPVMNTKTQDGYVLKGGSNANKVWGTDASGNPGWTTPAAYTLPLAADGTRGGIQIGYTQSGKNYPVQLSGEKAFVNVPWTDTTYGNATQSAAGLMSATDKTKLDEIEAQANKYVLPQATSGALGGFKIGWTGSGKDYPVELDSNGKAHVAVPWTDTTYTLPLAASGTRGGIQIGYSESGKKYAVKLDSEKAYVEVPWTADGGNAATVGGKTVAENVPSGAKFTDHEYTAGTGLSLSNGQFAVRLAYSTSGKNYKVQADNSGNLYVNVPWENTVYSLPLAANGTRGGVQIGFTTDATNRNYAVQLSNEKMYVNVPWQNTWRPVQNNLTSTSTTDCLSANQGKVLNDNKLDKITNGGIGGVSGNGSNWYFTLATITVTGAYINNPIVFEVSRRGYGYQRLELMFASVNNADPDVAWFRTDGNTKEFYFKKTATSTWVIYGKYNEVYGSCQLHRIVGGGVNNGNTVTPNLANAGTTAPTGVTEVTFGWSALDSDTVDGKHASDFVLKAGDTMTGNLIINLSGEGYTKVNNSTTGVGIYLLNEPDGGHGVYSNGYWNGSSFVSSGKWFVQRNQSGTITLNGDCTGNAATASKLGTATVGEARRPIYLNGGSPTVANYTVEHVGNFGQNLNMNDVGRHYASSGMAHLSGIATDNPANGSDLSTGWHLYWDTCYSEAPSGSNAWVAQIANKAGTNYWWVRSRSGGTITDGTGWASPWRHLVTSSQGAVGSTTNPVYVDQYGQTVACGYTIEKSVPSNAVFTDTNTWRPVQNNLTSTSTTDCLSAYQGKVLNDGKVAKAGDTMTGNLGVEKTTETYVYALNKSTSCKVWLDSAGNGEHGIWTSGYWNGSAYTTDGKWMIYRNTSGVINVNGNCSGSAGSATNDSSGRNIVNTYLEKTANGGLGSCAGNGTYPYFKLATLTIPNAYIDRPMVIELSRRGHGFQRLFIQFSSNSTADPPLQFFGTDGETSKFWIRKSTTSTWEIYGQFDGVWGNCSVHRITGSVTNNGVNITLNFECISSIPSGMTEARAYGSAAKVPWTGIVSKPIDYFSGHSNGSSTNNYVKVTFPSAGHAIIAIEQYVGCIFLTGDGGCYFNLPSGYSASRVSGTNEVNIVRTTSTVFYIHGIFLHGTTELPVSNGT